MRTKMPSKILWDDRYLKENLDPYLPLSTRYIHKNNMYRAMLQAFLESLQQNHGRVIPARKNAEGKFPYSSPHLWKKTIVPWLQAHEFPPKETQEQKGDNDYSLQYLIEKIEIIHGHQIEIENRLRDLAQALADGGHSGVKTAMHRLPWLRGGN